MAKRLTKKDREDIEKLAKRMFGDCKILTKEEHIALVKGKKIVWSKQATEDMKRLCKEAMILDRYVEIEVRNSRMGSGDDEFYAQQIRDYVKKQRTFLMGLIRFVLEEKNENMD